MNSNLSKSDLAYIEWTQRTTKIYIYYSSLFVFSFGLVFNLLTIYIYMRKRFKNTIIGFYNIIISIFDINSIILTTTYLFGQSIDNDFSLKSDLLCAFFNFSIRLSIQMAAWLNVIVTLDRLICIKFSNKKFQFLKKKRYILLIIFIMVAFLTIVNSANLKFNLIRKTFNNQTLVECTSSQTVILLSYNAIIIFRAIVPFTLMLILNLLLIKVFIQSRKKFSKDKNMRKEYQFAYLVIFLNLLFIVTLLPSVISYILRMFVQSSTNPVLYSGVMLFFNLSAYLSGLNNIFPFFVHLAFNKLFYKEFIKIINFFTGLWGFRKINVSKASTSNT